MSAPVEPRGSRGGRVNAAQRALWACPQFEAKLPVLRRLSPGAGFWLSWIELHKNQHISATGTTLSIQPRANDAAAQRQRPASGSCVPLPATSPALRRHCLRSRRLCRAEKFRDFFVVADLESDGVFRTRSGTSIDLQKSDRDWQSKKYFVLLRKIAISDGPILMTSRRLDVIRPVRGGGHRGLPRTT